MISFLNTVFIQNGTIIIWCLYFGGLIIKNTFPGVIKRYLPFISLIFGVLFMVFWVPAHDDTTLAIRINRGLVYGFAATGLHEVIKNIIYTIKLKYYSNPKRDRRNSRKLNIQ